jgi:hypothetical protein
MKNIIGRVTAATAPIRIALGTAGASTWIHHHHR